MIWKQLVTLKSYFTEKECCNRICSALFQDALPDLFLTLGSKEWSGRIPLSYLWGVPHQLNGLASRT